MRIQQTPQHVDTRAGGANTENNIAATSQHGVVPNSAVSCLKAWEQGGAPCEQRDVAVQRILLCWKRGEAALHLAGLGLKTQPPVLPQHVESIDFSGNNFTCFSLALPPNLKSLNLSRNELTKLEAKMNSNLEELNLESNQFRHASRHLPSGLKILNLKSNLLEQFPPNLPPFLEGVDVRGNKITDVTFLPNCMLINIDGDKLSPSGREILKEYRDAFKKYIGISDIKFEHGAPIIDIPEPEMQPQPAAKPVLTTSDKREMEKQLSELLGRIEKSSSDLPVALMEAVAAVPEEAPMAEFDPEPVIIAPPLSKSVAAWYPPARRAPVRRAWEKIEKQMEVKAETAVLSKFLVRLYQTVNKDAPGFQQDVRTLVEQAGKSRSLLEMLSSIATEGLTSCQDRVSAAFQIMQKAALAERALKGEFNGSLLKLIDLGRQAYRDEKLQEMADGIVQVQLNEKLKYYAQNPEERQKHYPGMADDKMKDEILTIIDPVGVYLLLRLQTLDQLAVNSSVRKMQYPPDRLVTAEKVTDAVSSIQASENKEFSRWLGGWSPWQTTLSKVNKTKYAQAMKKLEAQVSDPDLIKKKVDAKLLSEYDITPDSPLYNDAYQLAAPAITTQIREEIEVPLTLEFLKRNGMSKAVAPVWRKPINAVRLASRANPLSIR